MSMKDQLNSSNPNESTCCVCYKSVEIYSIGVCDHPVCYECSTRMRVLCKQKECPICRGDMPIVIFTREIQPFTDLRPNPHLRDSQHGLHFYSHSIEAAYYQLLEIYCQQCEHRPFRTFQQLKDHMRKEHELFYCDLCVENLTIFTFERKCYTRSALAMHRRKGDEDNKSHRGHPLCEFCDRRYMDSDELYRHLRRDHLFCHFCDADGKHQYYSTYDDLRKHFLEDHFLCEEGDCKNEQLTSVFRTEIDFKAHVASVHSKQLGRAAIKQARTLEFQFNFAPRRNDPGGQRNVRKPINQSSRINEEDIEGAVGYTMEPAINTQKKVVKTEENFPALGSESTTTSTTKSSVTFTSKFTPPNFTGNEFPTLGGSASSTSTRSNFTINSHKTVKTEDFPVLGAPRNITITKTTNSPTSSLPRNENAKSTSSSTLKLTVNQDRPQSMRPNLSIHVNQKLNGTVTTRISTAPSTSLQYRPVLKDAFPALSAATYVPSIPQQWVQPKVKKVQEPKIDKVAPAPVLPPRGLSDFPTLSKKTSSVTVPVNTNWVAAAASSASTEHTKTTDSKASNNKKEKTTSKKKVNEVNKFENINEINNKAKAMRKEERKKKVIEVNNENHHQSSDTHENNNIKKVNGMVKKTSTLKIGTLEMCEGGGVNASSNGNMEKDFPLLGKAPPGIAVKPPPGFNFTPKNDLTFTNSSGQSYPILPSHSYYPPSGFSSRNVSLIQSFIKVLKTNEAMNEFKSYSDLFRNGNYPAEKFYEHCQLVLDDQFNKIFPELLVLLPDINKQQELYRLFRRHKAAKNGGLVEECATCKQIIYTKELKQHLNSHYMENHFPSLGQTKATNNVWKK